MAAICTSTVFASAANDPAYGVDTDGDGIDDPFDPCPTKADGSTPPSPPSRDPSCYLGSPILPPPSWLPKEYTISKLGTFWQDCVPALVYPVRDNNAGAGEKSGFVVVGGPAESAAAAASNGFTSWPPAAVAGCLLSVDYQKPPLESVGLRGVALATLYALWNGPDTAGSNTYQPTDGLGLALGPLSSYPLRAPTVQVDPLPIQRIAFSRATVYGRRLDAGAGERCADWNEGVARTEMDSLDPLAGTPPWTNLAACANDAWAAADAFEPPADWAVVPTALDTALLSERERAMGAVRDNSNPLVTALEGVPFGLRLDDRSPLPMAPFLLPTRALLVPPVSLAGAWTVIPEAIAAVGQHLHFVAREGDDVLESYTTEGPAQYASASKDGDQVLVAQAFQIDQVNLGSYKSPPRTVEAVWPEWPSRAATSQSDASYGTRWTTNGGPADCWASGVFDDPDARDQQLAYPVELSSSERWDVAGGLCPSALTAFREGTAKAWSETAEANGGDVCKEAADGQERLKSVATLVSLKLDCVRETLQQLGIEAGSCDFAACDPFSGMGCGGPCAALAATLPALTPEVLACIARRAVAKTQELLPPDIHWPELQPEKAPGAPPMLIPMVGLLWNEGTGRPLLRSEMTKYDNRPPDHQGMDWNWVIDKEESGAIDPRYRPIAVRDGAFIGIEPELEFLVARGLWEYDLQSKTACDSDAWYPKGAYDTIAKKDVGYDPHGEPDLARYLEGDVTIPGQIWPTQYCDVIGINRNIYDPWVNNPSIPSLTCQTDPTPGSPPAVYPAPLWRTHYGRGMFAPMIPAIFVADTSRMAVNPEWPQPHWAESGDLPASCDPGPVQNTKEIPLGVESWDDLPHRLTFYGRPIIDCGHGGDSCEPGNRLEIHPVHLLTMDLARVVNDPLDNTDIDGVMVAAFGWVNIAIEGKLEFDLWPPVRTSVDKTLVVRGIDAFSSGDPEGWRKNYLEDIPSGEGNDLGFTIDPCGPQSLLRPKKAGEELAPGQPLPKCDRSGAGPKLVCTAVPTDRPNHVHCVYTDPAGGTFGPPESPDPVPRFPLYYTDAVTGDARPNQNYRMLPFFGTSRFDLRIVLGWK